jgi:hypothetical protein
MDDPCGVVEVHRTPAYFSDGLDPKFFAVAEQAPRDSNCITLSAHRRGQLRLSSIHWQVMFAGLRLVDRPTQSQGTGAGQAGGLPPAKKQAAAAP